MAKKPEHVAFALGFAWKQNPSPHSTHSKRFCSDFTNPLFSNTFIPVDLDFKYKLPPKKAIFMLSEIPNFPFTEALLYCLVLGEFYLGLSICTKTQLFHFFPPFFFPHRKTCLYQPPNQLLTIKRLLGPFIFWKTGFKREGVMETVSRVISCFGFQSPKIKQ